MESKRHEGFNALTVNTSTWSRRHHQNPPNQGWRRTALQNAAEVAILLLTTDCIVVEKPKEDKGGARHTIMAARHGWKWAAWRHGWHGRYDVSAMGTFASTAESKNVGDRHRSAKVTKLLVDTGSDYTWLPAKSLERIGVMREKKDVTFQMANGQGGHSERRICDHSRGKFFTC